MATGTRLYFTHGSSNHDNNDDAGQNMLPIACVAGNIPLVKMLLEHGKTDCLIDAMNYACIAGNVELVKLLLEYINDDDLDECFIYACEFGHITVIHLLKELNVTEYGINQGMILACQHDRDDVVDLLISLGANEFNDAFIKACEHDKVKTACHLLNRMPKTYPISLYEALRMASKNGHKAMVWWLLNRVYTKPLHNKPTYDNVINDYAVTTERIEWIKTPVDEEDIDMTDSHDILDFNGSLLEACTNGHYEIATYLIQCGANNFDVCMLAICNEHETNNKHRNIMLLLHSHGCTNLSECLTSVCYNGSYFTLEILVSICKFTVDELNNALRICSFTNNNNSHLSAIALLIRNGADKFDILNSTLTQSLLNLGCHNIVNNYAAQYKLDRMTAIAQFLSVFDEWRWPGWDYHIINNIIAEYYAKY